METTCTPLPGAPTIDRISSAVHRGVSRDGGFVDGGARNQEPDGDTRHRDSDLDRFGPSDRRNTLRPVSLVNCIEMCPLRGTPASPYIVWRRVTSKVSYLVLLQCLEVHAKQRRACLDLTGRATSDGAAHVPSCGTRGYIPHS